MKARITAVCERCRRPFVKRGRNHKRCCPACHKAWHRDYMKTYMREYRRGLRRRSAAVTA